MGLAELSVEGPGRSLGGVDRVDGTGAMIRSVLAWAGIDCMVDLWWPRTHEEDLALLAADEETGWWDERGRPAPWPEDIDDPDSDWSTPDNYQTRPNIDWNAPNQNPMPF